MYGILHVNGTFLEYARHFDKKPLPFLTHRGMEPRTVRRQSITLTIKPQLLLHIITPSPP